jgi:hypothetical protein
VRYLSPEWFEAASKALAADEDLRRATAQVALTLEQTVPDAPDGPVSWHIALDHGENRLAVAPHPDADLRFRTSYRVAEAIARGELAAPQAFIRGDLVVSGDLSVLTTQLRSLAAVDDALRDVRMATTFADGS